MSKVHALFGDLSPTEDDKLFDNDMVQKVVSQVMGDICSLATFQLLDDQIQKDIKTETTTLQHWVDNSPSHGSECETKHRLVEVLCRVEKILLRCTACINALVVANDAELRKKSNVDGYSGIGPKFPVNHSRWIGRYTTRGPHAGGLWAA